MFKSKTRFKRHEFQQQIYLFLGNPCMDIDMSIHEVKGVNYKLRERAYRTI